MKKAWSKVYIGLPLGQKPCGKLIGVVIDPCSWFSAGMQIVSFLFEYCDSTVYCVKLCICVNLGVIMLIMVKLGVRYLKLISVGSVVQNSQCIVKIFYIRFCTVLMGSYYC